MNTIGRIIGISFAVVAALAVVLGAGSPAGPEKGALDGTTFIVRMGEKGKQEYLPDTLIFKTGTFRSKECDPYGFGSGRYTTTAKGDTIAFTVETESEAEGKIAWRGEVAGNRIDGGAVWTKEGQDPIEYWFNGAKMK